MYKSLRKLRVFKVDEWNQLAIKGDIPEGNEFWNACTYLLVLAQTI